MARWQKGCRLKEAITNKLTPLSEEQAAWVRFPYKKGESDKNHTFEITMSIEYLLPWFAKKPTKAMVEDCMEDEEYNGDENELYFEKLDESSILITYPVPTWWCDEGVNRVELEDEILNNLNLERRWISSFECNG